MKEEGGKNKAIKQYHLIENRLQQKKNTIWLKNERGLRSVNLST